MNKQYKTQYMKLLKSFLRDNTKNTARIIL